MFSMLTLAVALATTVAATPQAPSSSSPSPPAVQRLAFLAGDWDASGPTDLGNAEGAVTFAFDAGGYAMVRRNHVRYTSGAAAGTTHDDVMVIFEDGAVLRAIYTDNEGHTIRYTVTIPADGTAVFESDPTQPGPRYRLTHTVKNAALDTTFEIASPGQPFKTYVTGRARRK